MVMPPRRTRSVMAIRQGHDGEHQSSAEAQARFDLLEQRIQTLAAAVERVATLMVQREQGPGSAPGSMPPLEDAPMNQVNAAAGYHSRGDQPGDAEGVGDSEGNYSPRPEGSRGSIKSYQRTTRGRARERVVAPQQEGLNASGQPTADPRNAVSVEPFFACGDLREKLNAQRGKIKATRAQELASDSKALAERMGRLESQIGSRLNSFEQVVRKVAEAVDVDARSYTSHDHPFVESIIRVPLPDKYKPPPIPLYDGRSDPDDHLEVYTGHMLLHGYPEEVMCRAFRNHLSDSARRWFRSLKPNSIASWDTLKNAFLTQFIGVKKYVPPRQNLSRVFQGQHESLKDWIARFGEQVAATEGITDEVALMGALASMKRGTSYSTDLDRRPPQSYKELLARAQGFINAEEAQSAREGKGVALDGTGSSQNQPSNWNNRKKRRAIEGEAPSW